MIPPLAEDNRPSWQVAIGSGFGSLGNALVAAGLVRPSSPHEIDIIPKPTLMGWAVLAALGVGLVVKVKR